MDLSSLEDISYGMYLITTSNGKEDAGCIINTLTQITSKNPIVSVSINKNNYTNKILKESNKFAVSIISENIDPQVISKFGYLSSEKENKFENINYELDNKIKVITDNMCSYLTCEVLNIIDAETHDIFIARVESTKKLSNLKPMTYKYYKEVLKGISPKNAPTYIENKVSTVGKKYRCKICGYIYDNEKEKIPFEELPEDFKCPLCGAGKDMFEEIK